MALEAIERGGTRLLSRWWLIVVLALGVGAVAYIVVASGGSDAESQAVIGLSENVTPEFLAQERDLIIERGLAAGLAMDAIRPEVDLEVVPADGDITRILINATGPEAGATVEVANRVAGDIVALSQDAAQATLADELARLEQLESAQSSERDEVQASLTAAIIASENDAAVSVDVIRFDEQLRSLESRISDIQANQVELESAGATSSAVLVSQARESSVSTGPALEAGILGALAGALVGLLLAAGVTGRDEAPSAAARETRDPLGLDDPATDAVLASSFLKKRFEDPKEVFTPREEDPVRISRYGNPSTAPLREEDANQGGRYGIDRTFVGDPEGGVSVAPTPESDSPTSPLVSASEREPEVSPSGVENPDLDLSTVGDVPDVDLSTGSSVEDPDAIAVADGAAAPVVDWPEINSDKRLAALEPFDLDTTRVREILRKVQSSVPDE